MPKKSQIRIGIDARFYGPKQKGLGRYVQKLVENLEKCSPDKYQFIIFLRKENWSEYQPGNPNFKKVLADYKWYGLKEQILMPWKIRQAKIDLMHFPHFNIPLFYSGPFVVTIHDLILKRFPTRQVSTLGPFLYWLKKLAYHLVIYSAIKRARKIIAVSNYTKEDILRYFRVNPDKIEVIYEGSPMVVSPVPDTDILRKINIKRPYLLYVGNAYPHKNLEQLVWAFEKLTKDYQKNLHLVLVGELDYFYKRLQDSLKKRPMQISHQRIIFTDFVSDEDLAVLYQNASLYIFPSLCEGFGLPPLEAMTYRLPVVCSEAACLPEVLKEAAVYFNPEDIEDMAEKIRQVLEDKELQEKLVARGSRVIQKYSWSKMAQRTLKIYQELG